MTKQNDTSPPDSSEIRGDSSEYELLKYAAESCFKLNNPNYILSCEIGVREGLGSKIMMDTLATKNQKVHYHIGIDPYGNLSYAHYDDNKAYRADYTNTMRDRLKKNFLAYPHFHLMNMTDIEFMHRYRNGLPVYDRGPARCSEYSCVHFDGPHRTVDVIREVLFFCDRSHVGTTFCFDDYKKYNMELIGPLTCEFGFRAIKKGNQKLVLRKEY